MTKYIYHQKYYFIVFNIKISMIIKISTIPRVLKIVRPIISGPTVFSCGGPDCCSPVGYEKEIPRKLFHDVYNYNVKCHFLRLYTGVNRYPISVPLKVFIGHNNFQFDPHCTYVVTY